ncbi:THUMP domain-containing protein [Candidatus Harpocratesius sp.]
MQKFNLLVSTAREFEEQAKTELWFNLMSLGDPNPIIYKSNFQGLILGYTNLPPRRLIYYLRDVITSKDVNYIQFIQKIYPIDLVTATELPVIKEAVLELIAESQICHVPTSKFRITVRKRNSPLRPEDIINSIAPLISNPVDLKNFDWNLQFEILGKQTGIAILSKDDIFKPISERRDLLYENDSTWMDEM